MPAVTWPPYWVGSVSLVASTSSPTPSTMCTTPDSTSAAYQPLQRTDLSDLVSSREPSPFGLNRPTRQTNMHIIRDPKSISNTLTLRQTTGQNVRVRLRLPRATKPPQHRITKGISTIQRPRDLNQRIAITAEQSHPSSYIETGSRYYHSTREPSHDSTLHMPNQLIVALGKRVTRNDP